MRNEALALLDGLVGRWAVTLSDAWFLEPPGTEVPGTASFEWIDDAFLLLRLELDGTAESVIGRSDANEQYKVLYHDDRGVSRLFEMTWGEGRWEMLREDPDFHQRFLAEVEPDVIRGHWDASEDEGATWKKDFDLTFRRAD